MKRFEVLDRGNKEQVNKKQAIAEWGYVTIYFVSFDRWQITSTARLKANPKATASHKEALVINALIIMIRENKATITVKAFFSVKYFFIIVDLHGLYDFGKYKFRKCFFYNEFGGMQDFFD